MEVIRHRSKVDWWVALILVAVPLGGVVAAVAGQLSGDAVDAVVGWVALVGIIALYVALVWPIEYELHADALVVRFGVVRSRVPYASMRGVRPSRNLLASPALSADRLAIDTGSRLPILISPSDPDRFFDELAARAPQLVRAGAEVITGER